MARKPPYFPVIAFLHSSQAVWIYTPMRGNKMQTGSKKLNVSSMCFFSVRKDSESANSKQEFQIRFFSLFFFFRLANACTKQMSLTFSRLKHIKEKTSLFFFFCCSRSFLLFSCLFAVDGSITSIHDRAMAVR